MAERRLGTPYSDRIRWHITDLGNLTSTIVFDSRQFPVYRHLLVEHGEYLLLRDQIVHSSGEIFDVRVGVVDCSWKFHSDGRGGGKPGREGKNSG